MLSKHLTLTPCLYQLCGTFCCFSAAIWRKQLHFGLLSEHLLIKLGCVKHPKPITECARSTDGCSQTVKHAVQTHSSPLALEYRTLTRRRGSGTISFARLLTWFLKINHIYLKMMKGLESDQGHESMYERKHARESEKRVICSSSPQQKSACNGCCLTTLIVPCVDSPTLAFWSTRRTQPLMKESREVSYWTRDCFLIQGTLTILVNRNSIQVPAWDFFSIGILLGLIFKVNAQMPGKGFFFFILSLSLSHALSHSLSPFFVLSAFAGSSTHEVEKMGVILFHRIVP